jgi:cytochrome P450
MFSDIAPFRRDPLAFLVERVNTATEPLVPLHFGLRPVYLLADPDHLKPLLRMPEDVVDKGPMIKKFRAVTGDNIVVRVGKEHQRRRAALRPLVARPTVEKLMPELAAEVRKGIAGAAKAGTFDARDLGSAIAMRIITLVTVGSNILSTEHERIMIESFRQATADLADVIFGGFSLAPWTLLARRRRIEQSRRSMQVVVRHVRERVPESSLIGALSQLRLSEREMANELLTFLIAGHDTTGTAAAWLFHALATVPGLADEIAAEAAAIRDERGEIDITKLPATCTTTAAVQEILRLYPSAYWFARGTRNDMEFAGRKLRRGTSVMISPWALQRAARFWNNPNEFRLDRSYSSKAYIPFGTGPRVCLGASLATLELEIMALEMASAFHLTLVGTVCGPSAWTHLAAPSMPMRAQSRCAVQAGAPAAGTNSKGAPSPTKDAESRNVCPFHAPAQ